MNTDQTALLITAILSTGVAVTFAAVVSLRHNDAANRLWAAGFAVYATGAWAAALLPGEVRPIESGIAAGCFAFLPVSLSWGAAQLHGHRVLLEPAALVVVVGLGIWVGVATGGPAEELSWAVLVAVCAIHSLIAGIRFLDGPLRHNLNARILAAVGAVCAVSFGFELLDSTVPDLSYDVTSYVLALLVVISAPCLTALRVEQSANWWATRDETVRRDLLGVLSSAAFLQDAEERMRRAARTSTPTYLTRVRIDGLAEINTAFGRDAGDAALAFAARVLANYTPASTLLGNLGAGHFAILSMEDGALIESAVRSGLLRDPLPPLLPTRFEITTAVAVSEQGSSVTDLLDQTSTTVAARSSHTAGPASAAPPHEEPHRETTPTSEDGATG